MKKLVKVIAYHIGIFVWFAVYLSWTRASFSDIVETVWFFNALAVFFYLWVEPSYPYINGFMSYFSFLVAIEGGALAMATRLNWDWRLTFWAFYMATLIFLRIVKTWEKKERRIEIFFALDKFSPREPWLIRIF